MNLYQFNRTGLLTKETTYLLKNLDYENNWNIAESKLYSSGYIPSEGRNKELYRELKRRFLHNCPTLPSLDLIRSIAKSNLNVISKAEIYFVYLFNADKIISDLLKQVYEIYDRDKNEAVITRNILETLIKLYLKKRDKKITEKTIQNWLGKFISTLKEIRIFLPKNGNTYLMNIGGLSVEAWTFFLMDAYLNEYTYQEAYFKVVFHILPEMIPAILKRCNKFDWVSYSLKESKDEISFHYQPKYRSIDEWLAQIDA